MKQNHFHIGSGNDTAQFGMKLRKRSGLMRKDLLAISLGTVLSGATLFSSFAADTLAARGLVPSVVANGKAVSDGEMPADTIVNFSIGLPLRNREVLSNLITEIYDPSSANYHHYLTPQQFTEHFGPTEQDYKNVIAFAEENGLTVRARHANRVVLSVSGTTEKIEKAFNVHLNRYQHPTEAREFFAPDRAPAVDASLPILQVSGLDNFSLPKPHSHLISSAPLPQPGQQRKTGKLANSSPNIGSGPGGGYIGTDFRAAYAPNVPLTGSGQNVGLLQFDGFFQSDIQAYETLIGLTTPPNLVVVPIDGGVPIPGFNSGEVSLDIEMVMSMAPAVQNIYVYEAPNSSPWVDVLSRMANDNVAKQISCSWGGGGPDAVAEQIFQQMAVQGQSFFTASGDSDAFTPGESIPFPGDSPHITVVGGTTLDTAGAGLGYASETVWNWGGGIGSGGGLSTFYPIPSWQTNVNFTSNHGSKIFRNTPDVAMTADNVYVLYGGGQAGLFGGTSCAAPLWAGFSALINQQAAASSHAPVGFLNPAFYSIATNSAKYASAFHDVTVGDNTRTQSPTQFFAGVNYDLCTGLGSPNGINMINAILALDLAPVHISPPPPPYPTSFSSLNGGSPNGSWSMFVQDDAPVSSGMIANGWILSLTTADVVGTSGDVELTMSTTNNSIYLSQPITFVISVTNYGPSISTNVTVTDPLPLNLTVLSTNVTQGAVTRSGTSLLWNVGTLNVGAGASLVLTIQPQTVGAFDNTATCSAGTDDPNPDDDSKTVSVNVASLTVTLAPTFNSTDKTFHISVPGPVGASVVIQANSNLVSTNWVDVYTGTAPVNFIDPVPSTSASRFYRAIVTP